MFRNLKTLAMVASLTLISSNCWTARADERLKNWNNAPAKVATANCPDCLEIKSDVHIIRKDDGSTVMWIHNHVQDYSTSEGGTGVTKVTLYSFGEEVGSYTVAATPNTPRFFLGEPSQRDGDQIVSLPNGLRIDRLVFESYNQDHPHAPVSNPIDVISVIIGAGSL